MRAIIEYEIETIDGIEYKLYVNAFGPAVRVFDVEANEVVTIVNYPNMDKAQGAFDVAVEHARGIS